VSDSTKIAHVERAAAGEARGALVFFHGFYGVPGDFLPFMDKLDPSKRLHAFLPQGPHPVSEGRSSWVDPTARDVAGEDLAPIEDWLDSLPFAPGETVLGGWSQGTSIAYALALLRGRPRPAGLIALGGQLPRQVPLDLGAPIPPILIAHGLEDDAIPVEAARHARDQLRASGTRDVVYIETNVGHTIDPVIVPELREFILRLL
jgi:phospholipase/carboxylesterase